VQIACAPVHIESNKYMTNMTSISLRKSHLTIFTLWMLANKVYHFKYDKQTTTMASNINLIKIIQNSPELLKWQAYWFIAWHITTSNFRKVSIGAYWQYDNWRFYCVTLPKSNRKLLIMQKAPSNSTCVQGSC